MDKNPQVYHKEYVATLKPGSGCWWSKIFNTTDKVNRILPSDFILIGKDL